MTETQGSTTQASKSWRVLECTPRWGLDGKATGREVYIEIDGKWGDAGKDAKLIEAAPEMLEALRVAQRAIADALDNMPYLWWRGDDATAEQKQWRAKLMLESSNARAAIEKTTSKEK